MRFLGILCFLAGCSQGASNASAREYGMMLHLSLAQSEPRLSGLSLSTLKLHLLNLTAVSDRSSSDARALIDVADVDFGATADIPLPSAPPGTYSAVEWTLGDSMESGIDLEGTLAGQHIHLQLTAGANDTRCPEPEELAPGQRVQLTLAVDATHWFDSVDLTDAKNDEDDSGIIINMEDNADLAQQILQNSIKSFQLECQPW
jgi:hypothetical protein